MTRRGRQGGREREGEKEGGRERERERREVGATLHIHVALQRVGP